MKFKFLKSNKDNTPKLLSLRKVVFDTQSYWFMSLGIFLIIFVVTSFVGFKLFYSVYSESYKKRAPEGMSENLINITKLKNIVDRRENFITATTSLPRDPSL